MQVPFISQPMGLSRALPALGGVAQAGFGAIEAQQKRRSLLEAQQGYAQYLAKVDAGTATPQDHAVGRIYGMSLGIEQKPMDTPDPRLMSYFQQKAGIEGAPIRGSKANIGMAETIAKMEKPPIPKTGAGVTFPKSVIDSWIKKLTTNNPKTGRPYANLSDIPGGMSANSLRAQVAGALGNVEGYDVGQGVISRSGATSESAASGRVRGGKGSEVASAVGSLHDTIGFARPYVMKLNKSDIPVVNEAFQKGLASIEGNPDATALLVHMNEMRGQYAQIIHGGGTPTDQDYQEATKVLRGGLNPAGFDAMSEAVVKAGRSRAGRLTGRISNEDVFKFSPGRTPTSGNDLQDAIDAL